MRISFAAGLQLLFVEGFQQRVPEDRRDFAPPSSCYAISFLASRWLWGLHAQRPLPACLRGFPEMLPDEPFRPRSTMRRSPQRRALAQPSLRRAPLREERRSKPVWRCAVYPVVFVDSHGIAA